MVAPKTDTLNLSNYPIGVKKRLDEIASDNLNVSAVLSVGEFQRIFERIMNDIKDNNQWNDLSLDMLLGHHGELTRRAQAGRFRMLPTP